MSLTQQLRFAIGFKQQNALGVALAAADMVSLHQTQSDLMQVSPVNEDDSQDIGKGVYTTQLFKSYMDAGGPWNGYLTSEAFCILNAFALGNATKAATVATGGFKYTSAAPDFTSIALDLPVNTALFQEGNTIDEMLIGLALEEFTINYKSGGGRENATFTSTWLGTGAYTKPSGLTMPAIYAEHELNAGGLSALTLIGYDYLSNKRFVDLTYGWKNNIRDASSRFPGSGNQGGYQLRGRMRRGSPTITLTATVEVATGTSEEDALLAQTTGTGTITCLGDEIASGPESHQAKLSFAKLGVKTSKKGDSDGIRTYQLEYSILQPGSTPPVTSEGICTLDNILVVAS
jgi:hypothetical protein